MVRTLGRLVRGLVAAAVLAALLVGLPWALWQYIGWPLPDDVPTWDEVQAVLLGPMSTSALLNLLACLSWTVWAAFTLDVARCVAGAACGARWTELPAVGPVHAVAAVLIGAIMLPVLDNRSAAAPAGPRSTALGTAASTVAAAPASRPTPQVSPVHHMVLAPGTLDVAGTTTPSLPASVVVRAPDKRTGVHDSLWRIAQRSLGSGARWPEIFALNKGKPQPGGGTLTNPSLIFPGEELALPANEQPSAPPQTPHQPIPVVPTPSPATADARPPTTASTSSPAAPASSAPKAPARGAGGEAGPAPSKEPDLVWGPGLFLGSGLAAAVSAALLVARRRYRRGYRPGSGRRDDLPVAPVIYQLRLAHLRAQHDGADLEKDSYGGSGPDELAAAPPPLLVGTDATASRPADTSLSPVLGVRDGREIALDLAVARGLGLVGDGAWPSARALILAALTTPPLGAADLEVGLGGATVIVPADDLGDLLGRDSCRTPLPARLRITAGLDQALDELEAEILIRARTQDRAGLPSVVLVAQPPQRNRQRLQAVLDNGSAFSILGVLLGQWQPGITAYVRDDGTVSAASPGLGHALNGTRMFALGNDDTTELLTLLHRAQPENQAAQKMPLTPPPNPRTASIQSSSAKTDDPEQTASIEREVEGAPDVDLAMDSALEITGPPQAPPRGTRRPLTDTHNRPAPDPRRANTKPTGIPPQRFGTNEPTAADDEAAAAVPLQITVLGPPRLHWRNEPGGRTSDITGAFQPRTRELLVFLAVHPGGATREALVAALWPDNPPDKTTNAMNTALSRLRRALTQTTAGTLTDLAIIGDGHYQLDPTLVDVDYWHFDRANTARRTATTEQTRVDAYRDLVNHYTGPLADGLSTEWIESAREATRRDAIDAVAALARALIQADPEQTLDLLETARAFDPHNELLYRDIMRLQHRLGRLNAIPRTLTLLTTRLAELDDKPTEETVRLATRLHQRHENLAADRSRPANHANQKAHRR